VISQREIIDVIQNQFASTYTEAIITVDQLPGKDLAILQQPHFLDLWSDRARQRIVELKTIDIFPTRRQEVEVDMVELLVNKPRRPINDVAKMSLSKDKIAVDQISQEIIILVPDIWGDNEFFIL
jgi:hypothetical protein